MISINKYLDRILADFQSYLDEGHELCDLKSVNYDQGQIPDYMDSHVQQYYLLRYAYGYAFEYKAMYETLLKQYPFQKKISVTSIGCGTMLDYWALTRVLKQRKMENVSIKYTGIDQVKWKYQFSPREEDKVTFCKNDAVQELAQYDKLKSDVYFFPKSISEFSDDDFKRLCKVFKKTPIKKDRIHLLVSVRSDERSQQRDSQRVELLSDAIIKNGFQTDDFSDDLQYADDPDKKIRLDDSDFEHPSDVIDCLKKLNVQCSRYQDNREHCELDCEERLNRWPILNQGQVCYIILTFERKEP